MLQVEIRFKGQIGKEWSEWFGGLAISHSDLGETVLTRTVDDQSALGAVALEWRSPVKTSVRLRLPLCAGAIEGVYVNEQIRRYQTEAGGG